MGHLDMCCVKRCKMRRDHNPKLSFFRIPKAPPERREAWLKFAHRKTEPKNCWKICSIHFVSGKASKKEGDIDHIPTLNPPSALMERKPDQKKENDADEACSDEATANALLKIIKDDIKSEQDPDDADIVSQPSDAEPSVDTGNSNIKTECSSDMDNGVTKPESNSDADSSDSEHRFRRSPTKYPRETVCKTCKIDFKYPSKLRAHKKIHGAQPKKTYDCELCTETFTAFKKLTKHMKLSHGSQSVTTERRYMCDICGHCFHSSTNMKEHRRLHTGERPYHCDKCDKTFIRKSDLNIHERQAHMFDHLDGDDFSCAECGRDLGSKDKLRRHMVEEHTDEKHFHLCPECGKKFLTKVRLRQHMDTHSDVVYKCPQCDRTFHQRANLKSHVRGMHEGDTKFSCDVCKRKFGSKYNLKTHMRIHTGETQFSCSVCKKGYTDICNGRRHEQKCRETHGLAAGDAFPTTSRKSHTPKKRGIGPATVVSEIEETLPTSPTDTSAALQAQAIASQFLYDWFNTSVAAASAAFPSKVD